MAGRSATLVTATRDGAIRSARWWIDDATGHCALAGDLRREWSSRPVVRIHVGRPSAAQTASWSICRRGWPCRDTNTCAQPLIAGRLGASGWSSAPQAGRPVAGPAAQRPSRRPEALHLVYSDGLTTVSVFEQRGRLTSAAARVRSGMRLWRLMYGTAPRVATWQSGDSCLHGGHRRHRRSCWPGRRCTAP